MCHRSTECVLLQQNVSSFYRMCSRVTPCACAFASASAAAVRARYCCRVTNYPWVCANVCVYKCKCKRKCVWVSVRGVLPFDIGPPPHTTIPRHQLHCTFASRTTLHRRVTTTLHSRATVHCPRHKLHYRILMRHELHYRILMRHELHYRILMRHELHYRILMRHELHYRILGSIHGN
jgi:hypothetical protein